MENISIKILIHFHVKYMRRICDWLKAIGEVMINYFNNFSINKSHQF